MASTTPVTLPPTIGHLIVIGLTSFVTSWQGVFLIVFFVLLIVLICVARKYPAECMAFVKRVTRFNLGATGLNVEASPSSVQEIKPEKENQEQPATEEELKADNKQSQEEKPFEPMTEEEWRTEMFLAFFHKDETKASEAFEKLKTLIKDGVAIKELEIDYWRFSYIFFGDQTSLNKILDLTKDPEVSYSAYEALGRSYDNSSDYGKAIKAYNDALALAKDETQIVSMVTAIGQSLYEDNQKEEALKTIQTSLSTTKTPENLAKLYESLGKIYEKEKDPEMRAFALEKALEFKPKDKDLLFAIAYSYSEKEFDSLSLFHYKQAKHIGSPSPTTLNNLGVTYERLKMPIKSVESYKVASEKNETLASANLALRYINAGFADDAEKVINSVKSKENVHANIGTAISNLSEKRKAEDETEEQLIKEASQQRKFVLNFSEAWFVPVEKTPELPTAWVDERGRTFTFEIYKNLMVLMWSESSDKYQITGKLVNRASKIKISKEETIKWYPEIEKGYQKIEDGHLFFSSDFTQIEIMHKNKYSQDSFVFIRLKPKVEKA